MTMTEDDIERINKRGPNDLEETINKLKKQVEFLQGKCRQAGSAIIDQEITINGLKKEIDRFRERLSPHINLKFKNEIKKTNEKKQFIIENIILHCTPKWN